MTKRKILAIIIALIMSILLCACSASPAQSSSNVESSDGIFVTVSKGWIADTNIYQYIMYDPKTMVMYTYLDGNEGGATTVIYNADGTPKLYSPNAEAN